MDPKGILNGGEIDMSTLSLRLPNSLHDRVRELAESEGVSINQFISTAVAEKMSALMTSEYLAARAGRGDRDQFEAALGRIPNAPASKDDAF